MRIVLSGPSCTGKTTKALALSLASGIPATHALTMREILPTLFPGKTLRQCRFDELMALGMKRFEARMQAETALGNQFISDGCCLQEWLYGTTRLLTGADPSERPLQMQLKRLLHPLDWLIFKHRIGDFGRLVKTYAQTHYDVFFHLPLAFPFVADGHRPTSNRFREASEQRLLQTYDELGIRPITVNGSLEERLEQLLQHLGLPVVIPVHQAATRAVHVCRHRFDTVPLEQAAAST